MTNVVRCLNPIPRFVSGIYRSIAALDAQLPLSFSAVRRDVEDVLTYVRPYVPCVDGVHRANEKARVRDQRPRSVLLLLLFSDSALASIEIIYWTIVSDVIISIT